MDILSVITLRVSVRRDYGKISMEFGAEGEFQLTPDFSVRSGYQHLHEIVGAQFDDYEANVLPREQFDRGSRPLSTTHKTFTVSSAAKTQKGKDVYYSLKTQETQFAKFGVPLYEQIENYPKLKETLDKLGEYRFKAAVTMVVDQTGKNPRIISVEGLS